MSLEWFKWGEKTQGGMLSGPKCHGTKWNKSKYSIQSNFMETEDLFRSQKFSRQNSCEDDGVSPSSAVHHPGERRPRYTGSDCKYYCALTAHGTADESHHAHTHKKITHIPHETVHSQPMGGRYVQLCEVPDCCLLPLPFYHRRAGSSGHGGVEHQCGRLGPC